MLIYFGIFLGVFLQRMDILLLGKYYKDELTSEKDFFSFFAEDKFEFMQMMTSNKSAVCLETKLDFRKTAILLVQVMKIAVLYEML